MFERTHIAQSFRPNEKVVVFSGDCLEFLKTVPNETFQLVVTSPPYNIGKDYEKRIHLDAYMRQQSEVIKECVRTLKPSYREAAHFVNPGAIVPG